MARFYPGIPNNFRTWSVEEKEAWEANILHVLAYEQDQLKLLDPNTPEGQHNIVLALTGDGAQAEDVLVKAREAVKMQNLQGTTIQ